MAGAAPILDLSTLVERPRIAIDGELYEILSPDEVAIADLRRFAGIGRRIEEIGRAAAPTPASQDELAGHLDELARRIMVGVPEDVRARLSLAQLIAVVEVFTGLLPGRTPAGAAQTPDRPGSASGGRTPTGASSRPGSSASTAATPAGGSSRRRPGSSGPIS